MWDRESRMVLLQLGSGAQEHTDRAQTRETVMEPREERAGGQMSRMRIADRAQTECKDHTD